MALLAHNCNDVLRLKGHKAKKWSFFVYGAGRKKLPAFSNLIWISLSLKEVLVNLWCARLGGKFHRFDSGKQIQSKVLPLGVAVLQLSSSSCLLQFLLMLSLKKGDGNCLLPLLVCQGAQLVEDPSCETKEPHASCVFEYCGSYVLWRTL